VRVSLHRALHRQLDSEVQSAVYPDITLSMSRLSATFHFDINRIWDKILAGARPSVHSKPDYPAEQHISSHTGRARICCFMRDIHINWFASLFLDTHNEFRPAWHFQCAGSASTTQSIRCLDLRTGRIGPDLKHIVGPSCNCCTAA